MVSPTSLYGLNDCRVPFGRLSPLRFSALLAASSLFTQKSSA